MPEFVAPALGNTPNVVTIDLEVPADAEGVLYALGGAGGGLTCWVDAGVLTYEYNLFIIQRTKIRGTTPLPSGRRRVEVITDYAVRQPGGPLDVTLKVDRTTVGTGRVPVSAPLLFSANDCLDIGRCLGGSVSLDYFDRAPFPFNGRIEAVHVAYT
jgi:arylsulfatase